jgi:YidC/Oxa1 family membrane protein insertase
MANSPAPKKSSRLLEFALILILAYILTNFAGKWFFPSKEQKSQAQGIHIEMVDGTVRGGNNPGVVVKNGTDHDVTLANNCPMPPFDVFRVLGSGSLTPLTTSGSALPCTAQPVIPAGGKATVSLASWKYSLFGQNATYELRLKGSSGTTVASSGSVLTTRFEVYEPAAPAKIFRTFISKPFLNFLIFVASILPDHGLGIGIILLTVLVKLLLFWPTQRALEGQKKMQLLQPKLEAVKKQYASDPVKMQQETMRLWKEHGVNPVQSCLPIVLQFPILIGLFYVVRDASVLATSHHLIYPYYQHLTWDFNPIFLGMDLTKPSWIFPPLLVVMQFLQMRLSFQIVKNKGMKDGKAPEIDKTQQIQQQVMQYAMPLMIGFFAISFPAAVSLYWGVSTLFAIGQQVIVNREHLKV